MIVQMGVNWPRAMQLVAQSAYGVSEELGDAVAVASIIKMTSQDDGDVLFTFETTDDEVLGSEAGLEPGYREAYDAR